MTTPQRNGEAEATLRGSERLPWMVQTRVSAVLYEAIAREIEDR